MMIKKVVPRPPQRRHWKVLDKFDCRQMEPEEFMACWEVSYADLARICRCSIDTVKHWFTAGTSHREPTEEHKRRLAMAHLIWTEPESFDEIAAIYENRPPQKQ